MRALGGLNVSVGTSLAFEGDAKKTLAESDAILINLRTIVRNAREAYPAEDPDGKDSTLVAKSAYEDLTRLADIIQGWMGARPISFDVFLPSYKSLPNLFSKADLWIPTTDQQKKKADIEEGALKVLRSKLKGVIKETDSKLLEFSGNGVIVTHHPVDLVLTKAFSRLKLLESYTGTVKGFTQWYTKLTGGDDLYYMPLNKLTIQIFGDRSVNFRSSTMKTKALLKDIAVKGKWTSATTVDRVRSTINLHASGFDRAALIVLLN